MFQNILHADVCVKGEGLTCGNDNCRPSLGAGNIVFYNGLAAYVCVKGEGLTCGER